MSGIGNANGSSNKNNNSIVNNNKNNNNNNSNNNQQFKTLTATLNSTAPTKNTITTSSNNSSSNLMKINSSSNIITGKIAQQHQKQTSSSNPIGKLQITQQQQQLQFQQRRSTISYHTTQQQQSVTAATLVNNQTSAADTRQSHQLQTVATIHTSEANSKVVPASPTYTRRSYYQLQTLETPHNLKAPTHSIPPRYQPPPQPQVVPAGSSNNVNGVANTGILKVPTNVKHYYSDKAPLEHKYPPDIPQLSSVYIPNSIKAQQQQQQRFLQQRQNQQDMLKFVRKTDQDHPSPNASVSSNATGLPTANAAGRLTTEQNRQLQSLVNELRALKEQNQRLLDDNQELRDLCCFLDDDRQKGRKLAREWQRFGRYTASVMRQEVAAYQNKLRQLDDKQQELITDNLELKELCLYLDEERAHMAVNTLCANCGASTRNALRDDGDGSSSSTNADETLTALRNYERQLPELQMRSSTALNDQTLQYVRSLERRIQQLEEERVTTTPTGNKLQQQQYRQQQQCPQDATTLNEPITGRPEAVVRALQVLEVREQLERDRSGGGGGGGVGVGITHLTSTDSSVLDQMDDGEKTLVREMCNVVWRKLEGSPSVPTTLEPL